MAFGSAYKQQKTVQPTTTATIWMDLKEGLRTGRILGNDVHFKVVWLEDVRVKDGKGKRPFIVGVLDPDQGIFVGADGKHYAKNNPLIDWINDQPEEIQKKVFPKQRFYVNFYDRTPVIKEDGVIYYPNSQKKYAVSGNPESNNQVMIIDQSSGKVEGKHFFAVLLNAADLFMNVKTGKPIGLTETDINILTKGTGNTTTRNVTAAFNQEPFTEDVKLYDLAGFAKPWPSEALAEIMNDADYNEVREKYNLPTTPQLM